MNTKPRAADAQLNHIVDSLLELLQAGNPQKLTRKETKKFRNWLQSAYASPVVEVDVEEPIVVSIPPQGQILVSSQPTSAHVDRVLQAILAWEGKARKRMARRWQRAPRGNRRD